MDVGKIQNVSTRQIGSPLYGAHAAGVLELTVWDAFEFDEDGGLLQLEDETLAYTGWVEDESDPTLPDTITLAAPTTVGHDEGVPVTVLPASTVKVATVVIDEEGEALEPVVVPQALVPTLADGIRGDNGETVTVEEVDGQWQIVSVDKDAVTIDGSLVDPDSTIPPEALTDGLPPSHSPVPTVLAYIRVLIVKWEPVANPDLVTYDVHVSTDPDFTPSAETLAAADVAGTQVFVRSTPAGALDYDTDYYVRIVARDADGPAEPSEAILGQATQVGLEDIVAGSITADLLAAVLVLASTIKLGDLIDIDVPRVDADGTPLGGIVVRDPSNPSGAPLVQLHPNGCKFRGELVTDLLTVMELARVVTTLMLGSGSVTTLENGVPDPDVKPTLTVGPEATSAWPAPPTGWAQRGISWDEVSGTWLRLLWNGGQKRIAIQRVSASGVPTSLINTNDGTYYVTEISSVCRRGDNFLVCVLETFSDDVKRWRLISYNLAGERNVFPQTFATQAEVNGTPAVGVDEAGSDTVALAWVKSGSAAGDVQVERYKTDYLGRESGSVIISRTSYTGNMNLRSVRVGSFDLGSPHVWISAGQINQFAAFPGWPSFNNQVPPVLPEIVARRFDVDATVFSGGSAWRPGVDRFYSTSNDQTLTRWSDYKPAGDATWTARYANTAGTDTTAASPPETILVPARRTVTVSLPPAPNGVTSASVWVGYADSGAASTLYKRSETLTAARAMVLAGKSTTGSTAVPTTNTMGGDPAIMRSQVQGPALGWDVDGAGNMRRRTPVAAADDVTNKSYVDGPTWSTPTSYNGGATSRPENPVQYRYDKGYLEMTGSIGGVSIAAGDSLRLFNIAPPGVEKAYYGGGGAGYRPGRIVIRSTGEVEFANGSASTATIVYFDGIKIRL